MFTEELKSATGQLHKTIESTALSRIIISPEISPAVYAYYLKVMYVVHRAIDEQVYPLLNSIVPDLNERSRTVQLEKDLTVWKKESNAVLSFEKPLFGEMSTAHALGMLYVIEGSTLGGRFILKNIQAAFTGAHQQGEGLLYLQGYGEHTGSKWKALLEIVNHYAVKHNSGDEIIAGAKQLYGVMQELFITYRP